MSIISVNNISKKFGDTQAVRDLSFDVQPGEIFGLLGPNGAGKTTTIRMILDIFKPDSGRIDVLGGPMSEDKKNKVGYLPEERGLYQDIPLERCLVFLATLKGMEESDAAPKIEEYLKHFDLYESRQKKVKELSKGMQQKAQLISTLVHDPELVIIDEPFTALDPVNTETVKDMLQKKRDEGKAIIMSTHQMNQVEELCDRILLIDSGERLLYGTLPEIQSHFSSHDILVTPITPLPSSIDGVREIKKLNGRYRLVLSESAEPNKVLKDLINQGVELNEFEIAVPPLNEIFIKVVKEQKGNGYV
ncbi:MAG: ATP-binding cassette domain-containing protein [Anaerolineaceae bacterium]|nr:ATP-binding cassette domain-containing protein [Anaerolineaceae bacterium]